MQYFISFTLFLDQDEEVSKKEIKDFIMDSLDSSGASVENIEIKVVKHY
jgi:hypothetical protein